MAVFDAAWSAGRARASRREPHSSCCTRAGGYDERAIRSRLFVQGLADRIPQTLFKSLGLVLLHAVVACGDGAPSARADGRDPEHGLDASQSRVGSRTRSLLAVEDQAGGRSAMAPIRGCEAVESAERGTALTFRIVEAKSGRGLLGLRVVTWLVTYAEPANASGRWTMEKTVLRDGRSGEDGSLEVEVDLDANPDGKCVVTAWSNAWAGCRQWFLDEMWGESGEDRELDLQVYPRTGTVRLRVVDASGKGVAGCVVMVLPDWEGWWDIDPWFRWPEMECKEFVTSIGLLTESGEGGEISIDGVPIVEGDPDETGYFAFAFDQVHASNKEWYEAEEFAYPGGGGVELPVVTIANLSLEGTVRSQEGVAVAASINVNGRPVTASGVDGRWRIEGHELGPGPWHISFHAQGYMELGFILPSPEYLLLDDAKDVQLTMTEAG